MDDPGFCICRNQYGKFSNQFLSYMCAGMAKISLMPSIFLKKNKRGAYYVGILMIGTIMILVNATGLSTSDSLSL